MAAAGSKRAAAAPEQPSLHPNRPLLAAAASLLLIYGAAMLWIASTRSVWSPDCGARLIQVQSVLQHWPHWWVSYPGLTLDPLRHNSPLSFYEFEHGGHTYIFYSFVFALISAFCFHLFGYAGLALLPMLCGIGTAVAVYGLARLLQVRYPLGPFFLTALATPIIIYSVVFWDHSITTCVAAACLYLCMLAIVTGRSHFWFAAGMVFGVGLWFHEILIPYLPAMLAGVWWSRRHHPWVRSAGLLLAGVALVVIPLALVNATVYGTPFGPHLSKNHLGSTGAISQFLLSPRLWGPGALYTLFAWGNNSPGFTWQLRNWLDNPSDSFKRDILISMKMALPLVSWMILSITGFWRRHWFASLALFVGLLAGGLWVLRNDDWPHSLFYASPVLALAFAGLTSPTLQSSGLSNHPAIQPSNDPRFLKQTMAVITLVYCGGALLNPALGGSEYGSRYLLIAVPALALLAWCAMESLAPTVPRSKISAANWPIENRLLIAGMAAIAVISAASQWHGLSVVFNMHASNRYLADSIQNTPDKIVITTVWWAPLDGAPAYDKKTIFYAGDPEHIYGDDPPHLMPSLLRTLRGADWRTFTSIGWDYSDLRPYAQTAGYLPILDTPAAMGLKLTRFGVP